MCTLDHLHMCRLHLRDSHLYRMGDSLLQPLLPPLKFLSHIVPIMKMVLLMTHSMEITMMACPNMA